MRLWSHKVVLVADTEKAFIEDGLQEKTEMLQDFYGWRISQSQIKQKTLQH